jgi:hypothetical protein
VLRNVGVSGPRNVNLFRLNLLLGVFAMAVVGLMILGHSAASGLSTTQADLSKVASLRAAAQKIQYDVASLNGRQTA